MTAAGHGHHHGPTCGHDHAHDHHHGPHHHATTEAQRPFADDALVSARGLWLSRGRRVVVEGVDLDLRRGEIVTLIGPNGAGKTTIARLMMGLERPDRGEVRRAPGLTIGYAPQRFDVDPAIPITVDRFLGLSNGGDAAARREVLAEVGAGAVIGAQLSELSGGELQRVVLARALLRAPDLLVLDEPVRGVDFAGEAELYTLIGRLRDRRRLGVLLVSHDLHVVMAASDHVVCVNRHVCCHGIPETVANHPEYARLFGADAVRALAIYAHRHDHEHALSGAPLPPTDATASPPRGVPRP